MSHASVLASQRTHDFATASLLALLAMLACRVGLDQLPPTAFAWPPLVPRNLDFGVVALFLPLAALVFGIVVEVGSSRVDLQACKLEYSIVSPK